MSASGRPAADGREPQTSDHRSASLPAGIVGRENELAELRAGLKDAVAGRARLFLLAGDPGIGKTTLAQAVSDPAPAHGARVAWGRCWEGEGAPAYWPWIQILATLSAPRGSTGPAAQLADLVSAPALDGGPGDPEAERFRLFDACATRLRELSASSPQVIVLDDLHLTDHPSVLLLEFLARELTGTRLMLVATFREAETHLDPAIRDTLGRVGCMGRVLHLSGLSGPDVRRLVARCHGGPVDPGFVKAVNDTSEGNPLFVRELTRTLEDQSRGDVPATVWPSLPAGAKEIFGRRLSALAPDCLATLRPAAVLGRMFALAPLERMTGESSGELLKRLRPAVEAGLVSEDPRGLGRYLFSHALVRATIYDDIPSGERAELHGSAAATLEALHHGERPAELAHHFVEAREYERGFRYLVAAGDRAVRDLAGEQAVLLFGQAIGLIAHQPPDDVRDIKLLLALGEAENQVGGTPEVARATFARAARRAARIGARADVARAALGSAGPDEGFGAIMHPGEVDEQLVDRLQGALDQLGDDAPELRARLLGRLAIELYFSGAHERTEQLSAEAVDVARAAGDPRVLAAALVARHHVRWTADNLAERLQMGSEALELAGRAGDRELALTVRTYLVGDHLEAADPIAADAMIAEHAREAQALRHPVHLWRAASWRAMRALLEGDLDRCEHLASEALQLGQRLRDPQPSVLHFGIQLLAVRREQGRLHEMVDAVTAFEERYASLPLLTASLAYVEMARGRRSEARAHYERAVAHGLEPLTREFGALVTLTMLATVAAWLGDRSRAPELLALLRPCGERYTTMGFGFACFGPVGRCLGPLAELSGDDRGARAFLETALELDRRMGARASEAWSATELARFLSSSRDPDDRRRATLLLDSARAAAAGLGLQALAADLSEPANAEPQTVLFEHHDDGWSIGPPGAQVRLIDSKGLRQLARLVADPGQDVHVLELAGSGRRGRPPILDGDARERLRDAREELENAEDCNDPERASRARMAVECALEGAVTGVVGPAAEIERARVNVTRSVGSALRKLELVAPAIAGELRTGLSTGALCRFDPDPGSPRQWIVRAQTATAGRPR